MTAAYACLFGIVAEKKPVFLLPNRKRPGRLPYLYPKQQKGGEPVRSIAFNLFGSAREGAGARPGNAAPCHESRQHSNCLTKVFRLLFDLTKHSQR